MKLFPTLIFFGVGNFFWIFGGFVHILCMDKMTHFFMKSFNEATVVEYTVFAFIFLWAVGLFFLWLFGFVSIEFVNDL